ncbi:homocysteine S-methyltransferase [Aspergillus terreus]|uniref:Homocysteine S-methyltransferase n=1 Tax=Aspergillus terreus TaxID=33178 RepID=A0A5M3YLD4_ASPTE|nr:hypothetical protein ATETN484_0001031700 [Aspergillus terreus]GFF12173.1 homocysteine S-methyltransferase [Aspergillus terreus]
MASIQILDGGLGTSLQDQYGVEFSSATTPLWSSHLLVSDPGTLQSCQHDFGVAGVDVLLTATYQVSIEGFARTKTADFPNGIPKTAIAPYLQTAVTVAEQAKARNSAKIALSLGPYGACMIPGQEYSGQYDSEHDSEEALFRWHLERLRLFQDAEGDLISRVQYVAFETLPRLDEVRAVRRAIRAAGIDVPFWVSCVFPREDDLLPDGSSIEQVVDAALVPMNDGGVPWGIGANCTKIHKLPRLVGKLGEYVAKRVASGQISTVPSLVLYPDGTNGEVYNTTTQQWEKPDGPESAGRDTVWHLFPPDGNMLTVQRSWETQLAQVVKDARETGPFNSFLVGGCCKASHHDIKKLRLQFATE